MNALLVCLSSMRTKNNADFPGMGLRIQPGGNVTLCFTGAGFSNDIRPLDLRTNVPIVGNAGCLTAG